MTVSIACGGGGSDGGTTSGTSPTIPEGTGGDIRGAWAASYRLPTGEAWTHDRLTFSVSGQSVNGVALQRTDPLGDLTGTFDGTRFKLVLDEQGIIVWGDGYIRSEPRYDLEGTISGSTAAGRMIYTDPYGQQYEGTFAWVRPTVDATFPTPADPPAPRASLVDGGWTGRITPDTGDLTEPDIAVSLDLKHRAGTLVVEGTGGVNGEGGIAVDATRSYVRGSLAFVVLADSTGRIELEGQLTETEFKGWARVIDPQDDLVTFGPFTVLHPPR